MQLLSDPLNDRVLKQLKPPPHRPLDSTKLFVQNSKDKIDWKLLKIHLASEGSLFKQDVLRLISEVSKIFESESNLLRVHDPITIVGDLHGQFYDLLKLLELGGNPEETQFKKKKKKKTFFPSYFFIRYLFLGDLVDRGNFSIETVILVYSLKLAYPKTINLLRGNHECREMTSYFNFREECLLKYDQEIYNAFMESFDKLPLACIVNEQIFACHGGISPELQKLEQVLKIKRFIEPPKTGLFCDLLWSDPNPKDIKKLPLFSQNITRGCSYYYSNEAAVNFLSKNKLISVLRGHEVQLEGYKLYEFNQQNKFPSIITIFSAPNYCDAYNNKGAIIKFKV